MCIFFVSCSCGNSSEGDSKDRTSPSTDDTSDDSECIICSTTSECTEALGEGWVCVGDCCESAGDDTIPGDDTQGDDTHTDDTGGDDTADDTTDDTADDDSAGDDTADDTSDDTEDDDSADDTSDDTSDDTADDTTDDTTDDTASDDTATDDTADDTSDDDTVDDGTWLFVGFNPNTTEPTPEFYEYDHGTLTALDLPDIGIKMISSIQRAPDGKQWIIAYTQYNPLKKLRSGGKEIWWHGATAAVILVRDPSDGSYTVYDQDDFPSWSLAMNFHDIAFLSNGDAFVPTTDSDSDYHHYDNYGIYHFNSASSEWTYETLPIENNCTGINSVVTYQDEVYTALYDYPDTDPGDGGRPVIYHRTDSGWVEMDIDFTGYTGWFSAFFINPDGVFYLSFLRSDGKPEPPYIYKIVDGVPEPVDPDRPSWMALQLTWWRGSLLLDEIQLHGVLLLRADADEIFYTILDIEFTGMLYATHLRAFNDRHACLVTTKGYYGREPFTTPYLVDGGDNFEQPEIAEDLYSTDCLYVPYESREKKS